MGVTVDKELAYAKYLEIRSAKWGLMVRVLLNFHDKHYERVITSLKELVSGGHPVAQYFTAVATIKYNGKATKPMLELLRKSADAGFTPAMYKLGKLLIRTNRHPQVSDGKALIMEAAELGHAKSIAHCGLYDLRPHELALVCSALNVSDTPVHWLHAFVLLNRWRNEPYQTDKGRRDVVESICFIAPPDATDEELEIFRDIVYNNGAKSIDWLEENASELMRLNCA